MAARCQPRLPSPPGLIQRHGLFAGPSSGANLLAARQLRAEQPGLRHIVTFFCDEGEKCLSDHFTNV